MTRARLAYRPPRVQQRLLLPHERSEDGVILAIEGPIGVGKTTLAQRLAEPLDAELVLEVVEDNPFLPHFYQDRQGYAFQTQIFFLLSRYRQQETIRRAHQEGRLVVSDYIFAKDQLFARMNLAAEELDLYTRLFELIAPLTDPPALVIYLTADLQTLLGRIAHRDRPFERAIDPAYLDRLCAEYEAFFERYDDAAVLTVDTDEVNIFTQADLTEILRYVDEAAVGL